MPPATVQEQEQEVNYPMASHYPAAVAGADDLSRLATGSITDIGGSQLASSLRSMLSAHLFHHHHHPPTTPYRLLPTALLSDDEGLQLWRTVTRLPDYYQTRDEIALLQAHGAAIARHVEPGTILIDLGCGDARKVVPLLQTLDRFAVPCLYLALDLSRPALERNLRSLAALQLHHVRHAALWGTFDNILAWAVRCGLGPPRLFLSLGSMLGNNYFADAVEDLVRWRKALRGGPSPDRILLGIDAMPSAERVWRSYHDEQGLIERLVRNGMSHVNTVLGWPWYRKRDWVVEAILKRDGQQPGQGVFHSFALRALRDIPGSDESIHAVSGEGDSQTVHVPRIGRGTIVRCYEAFKYGHEVMERQFVAAELCEIERWESPQRRHNGAKVVTAMHEYLLEAMVPAGAATAAAAAAAAAAASPVPDGLLADSSVVDGSTDGGVDDKVSGLAS